MRIAEARKIRSGGHISHLNKLLNFVCDGRGDENDEALCGALHWSVFMDEPALKIFE
jgi:hypothetical protein